MSDARTGSTLSRVGRFGVGVVSLVGAVAVVLSVLLSVYDFQLGAARSVVDPITRFPLVFVVVPGVTALAWFVVGVALLASRSVGLPLGAVAYLGVTAVNLVAIVSEVLGVRPAFLWHVDPVSPLVSLPLQILRIGDVASVGYPVSFYLAGAVGTVASLVIGGYLAVEGAREVGS